MKDTGPIRDIPIRGPDGWTHRYPVCSGLYWERFRGCLDKRLIVVTIPSLGRAYVNWLGGDGLYYKTWYGEYFARDRGADCCEWCGPDLAPEEE